MASNLETTAEVTTVVGGILSVVPVVATIHNAIHSLQPKYKLQKWSIRIDDVSDKINSKSHLIMHEEMENYLKMLKMWVKFMHSEKTIIYWFLIFNSCEDERKLCLQRIKNGTCTWYRGRIYLALFSDNARSLWEFGTVSLLCLHPNDRKHTE